MRLPFLFLAGLFFSVCSFGQQDSLKAILNQGIELNDKGDYDGALRIYDELIKQDETYYLAYNEKTLTLYSAGKYPESVELCKKVLKKFKDNPENAKIYVNYGSALDAMGSPDDAIKIYKEGMKKYPQFYSLPFNMGITEYGRKNYEEAAADLKKAIFLQPDHASSHQALAYCVYSKNKVAAILSLSTFLLLEPEGQRAERNLKMMLQLLGSNVKKNDEKNITITLSAESLETKNQGEDNFHQSELMLSLRSALDYDEKYKNLTPAQSLKDKLETIIPIDPDKKDGRKGFFMKFYIPFLEAMKADSLLETACHIIYSSSQDAVNKKWLDDNKDKVDGFKKWMTAYNWYKG